MVIRRLAGSFLVVFAFAGGSVFAQELDGRAIMDEVASRHERPAEVSAERVVLIDRGELEADRGMTRFLRRGNDGTYKYLMIYDHPAGIAGSASLTWEVKNGQDDQWLYLPALGKLKRVVGGTKRKNFMGTDFAFEDLTVEAEDDYDYTREDDIEIDGKAHYVIYAQPVAPDLMTDTGYSGRRIFVRQDIFLITRIDYFERTNGKLFKTLNIEEARNVEGETWRAIRYTMRTHADDHETRIEVLDVSFEPVDIPKDVFEHRYLTSRAHLR